MTANFRSYRVFSQIYKNYAIITQPLTMLLKKNSIWVWGDLQSEAFISLKSALSNDPVLKIYDPILPTELHCDTNSKGIAGILMQKHGQHWHPVAFYSKQCTYK